ncbi:hypothetical protein D5R81_17000 [Parashewanella spongiae]|uniref:Uncharacterized protein n=1 Tax=Parashewanella spongiae TaxID=342950 RepID=A0A3A6TH51_9GAMM|nr:hypothetical protein [Parashewanella spongiae]MCL1079772.1 hypothetical protein [Parashewanella spongiae]RJY06910.1 hypothetical protein D5R81_17000 [Parashewanella spongiae]
MSIPSNPAGSIKSGQLTIKMDEQAVEKLKQSATPEAQPFEVTFKTDKGLQVLQFLISAKKNENLEETIAQFHVENEHVFEDENPTISSNQLDFIAKKLSDYLNDQRIASASYDMSSSEKESSRVSGDGWREATKEDLRHIDEKDIWAEYDVNSIQFPDKISNPQDSLVTRATNKRFVSNEINRNVNKVITAFASLWQK